MRTRPGKLQCDAELRGLIQDRLALDWSPEQIAAWLRRQYPTTAAWHVCHETIYQALYAPGKSGLSRRLTTRLRTGRSLRQRRRAPQARTPRYRAPSRLIDERPQAAAARLRIGDWEGDLIVGRAGASAIGTLVDRRSRLVRLIPLPDGRDSGRVRDALHAVFSSMPPHERLTLTWDQGPEMAAHEEIGDLFAEGIYFAYPGAPWQRGTNENTNRLLRQYFPKGSDVSAHSSDFLQAVEDLLNNRPRKGLGWRTPAEVHASPGVPSL